MFDYFPFSKVLRSVTSGLEKYLNSGHERDREIGGLEGLDYMLARNYDSEIGRFLSVDPLFKLTTNWTPYRAFYDNPLLYVDPTGRLESTHIDEEGNVVAVFDDGDKGVYQHQKNADGGSVTEYQLSKRVKKHGSSAGGNKVGETEYWDEFISPETGKTMTNYRIQVGKSFDPIIDRIHEDAEGLSLAEIASKSHPGGEFDIKQDYANVGALLNGKYATSRSAGNFLAGYNACGATQFGVDISFETFQKLAGALHIEGSLTKWEMGRIVLTSTYDCSDPDRFVAPTYGEVMYQYRMSKAGWDHGNKKKE